MKTYTAIKARFIPTEIKKQQPAATILMLRSYSHQVSMDYSASSVDTSDSWGGSGSKLGCPSNRSRSLVSIV